MVNRYRPTSVLQLLLAGFALVCLPLGGGLIAAFISVDQLTERSKRAVFDAAQTVQASQTLLSHIRQMERHARQYHILGDRSLYTLAQERREDLQETATVLLHRNLPDSYQDALARILYLETLAFNTLDTQAHDSIDVVEALSRFPEMESLATQLLGQITELITRETEQVRRAATNLQGTLAWLGSALIVAAVGLSGWVAVLLSKPIVRLGDAMKRLGEGDFSKEIRIKGPADLEALGGHLNWLRLRLLELEQEKARFLRHVSHELKTPLTAIREGAELLRDQVTGPLNAEQEEVAGILRENSVRLQRLIEDLINFSVARTPTAALHPVNAELVKILQQVVDDHKLAMQAKDLAVDTELKPVKASVDREKLRVIVDNLVSNAIKYSPIGGIISVSLCRDGDTATIDVRDQGPGIPSGERANVFVPFFQGNAPYTGHVKGTGLGLAIAKEYVAAHDGSIDVLESGHGAWLRVRIPIAARQAA